MSSNKVWMHGVKHHGDATEAFVFGTRLTWLTPALRYSDVDTAVDKIAHLVVDWSGGTRIGESLKTFNARLGSATMQGISR